jgi:hypothetical protein
MSNVSVPSPENASRISQTPAPCERGAGVLRLIYWSRNQYPPVGAVVTEAVMVPNTPSVWSANPAV